MQPLIHELDAELRQRYPPDAIHGFHPGEESDFRGAFLVGLLDGEPVACGGVRSLSAHEGEIKRMFVRRSVRRRGLGRQLLLALEEAAMSRGMTELCLETGTEQQEALGLYDTAGWHRVEAFGEYVGSRYSVCYRKQLSRGRETARESGDTGELKMYAELASWWPLLSAPEEYAEEAGQFERILLEAISPAPRSLLELGSGGGNNASYLKQRFEMTLVDMAPEMLEVSRRLNPECEHRLGDMRTVRLDREFDAIFVHDAIAYMTTESDLLRAIENCYLHCRPEGVALIAPDYVRENFHPPTTDHGGSDGDGKSLRFLEWTWDPDPSDDTYVVDYAYLLRESDGTVHVERDRHVEGVFPRAVWLRLIAEAGFEPEVVALEHAEIENHTWEAFLCRKRSVR